MAYSNGGNGNGKSGFKFFGAEHLARFASPHAYSRSHAKSHLGKKHAEALAAHRKNLEALSEASEVAAEVMQTISKLQNKFLHEAFERMNAMMQEFAETAMDPASAMHPSTAKKRIHAVKEHVVKGVEHHHSLVKMAGESHKKLAEHFQKHLKEAFQEMQERASGSPEQKTAASPMKKEVKKAAPKKAAAAAATGEPIKKAAAPKAAAPAKKTPQKKAPTKKIP